MFKLHNNLLNVPSSDFFSISNSVNCYNLRGHKLHLQSSKFSGSSVRENFFSNRILSVWNKLPKDIVYSPSLTVFKHLLNKFDLKSIATTKF